MTTVHQLNLSDDAYHLLVSVYGMWIGVEMSDPEVGVLPVPVGDQMYAMFKTALIKRFGSDLVNQRFKSTLDELNAQLQPR